jgi:hypothetical protein
MAESLDDADAPGESSGPRGPEDTGAGAFEPADEKRT